MGELTTTEMLDRIDRAEANAHTVSFTCKELKVSYNTDYSLFYICGNPSRGMLEYELLEDVRFMLSDYDDTDMWEGDDML